MPEDGLIWRANGHGTLPSNLPIGLDLNPNSLAYNHLSISVQKPQLSNWAHRAAKRAPNIPDHFPMSRSKDIWAWGPEGKELRRGLSGESKDYLCLWHTLCSHQGQKRTI